MNLLRNGACRTGFGGRMMVLAAGLAMAMAVVGSLKALADDTTANDDNHANYYYPPPQTTETYEARVQTLAESDRSRRIGFVTGLTKQLLSQR